LELRRIHIPTKITRRIETSNLIRILVSTKITTKRIGTNSLAKSIVWNSPKFAVTTTELE
jgi:hypothetical protein